jgi:CheY-like chemotaxis protein
MAQRIAVPHSKVALVADDDEMVRMFIKEALEAEGFEVLLAPNGTTAAMILEKNPLVSLIVTDILMPDKDGLEFIRSLRLDRVELAPRPKVIAISGGGIIAPGLYLQDASLFGADITLPKPFSAEDLKQALWGLGFSRTTQKIRTPETKGLRN